MFNNAIESTTRKFKVGENEMTSNNERTERYEATGPLTARIFSASGDVMIEASSGTAIEVTLIANGRDGERQLSAASIEFDAAKNVLNVSTRSHDNLGTLKGFKSVMKKSSWSDLGHNDPNVLVLLPEGTTVEVTTASGETKITGDLNKVVVTSASGGVSIDDEVGALEVRTASGDVTTSRVRESLTCHSASGSVRSDGAGSETKVRTASGNVTLAVGSSSNISIRTVSGNVLVAVASGLDVDVDATSISGHLSSTLPLDSTKGGPASTHAVSISAKTVSGNVTVKTAA